MKARSNYKKKIKISYNEILLRVVVMILVCVLVYFSGLKDADKVITLGGFLLSFFVSIYLHRHFFPLMTASIFMYLVASLQNFMLPQYVLESVTKAYWWIGHAFLTVSLANFGINLIFRYKIIKNGDKQ